MRIVVVALLVAAAHFSLTAFVPTAEGKAWVGWPFAADTKPSLSFVGGLPSQPGSLVTAALAGIAWLAFLGAVLSLLGLVVPANWWSVLVVVGAIASALLYVLYIGVFSVVPMAVDAVLVWGVFAQQWSVSGLIGS